MNLEKLQTLTGIKDSKLLEEAVSHPSLIDHPFDYERLEFLGDSVLSLVISEQLMKLFPNDDEGRLAKKKAYLVSCPSIALVARKIELGQYLKFSDNEYKNKAQENDKILENAMEALLGAIYLDSGFESAHKFISTYWLDTMKEMEHPPMDEKSTIQEWAQKQGKPLPRYNLIERTGPSHRPNFVIELIVADFEPVRASGTARKKAEKEAAKLFIEKYMDKLHG